MMDLVKEYYNQAKAKYKEIGIDTDEAIDTLKTVSFSLKCCDIVNVYNRSETSDYKNEQENSPKLRNSLEKALKLIPGKHRISLNAVHMDANEHVELDEIEAGNYDVWIKWAKKNVAGVDLYTSMVRHEKSDNGFALSNRNKDIRYFWVEHCQRCRIVGEHIGKEMNTSCITTISINDFFKGTPIESKLTQEVLLDSLNKIYSEDRNKNYNLDSVYTGLDNMKESYIPVANSAFCRNYAMSQNMYINVNIKNIRNEAHIHSELGASIPFSDKIIINIEPDEDSSNLIVLNDKLKSLARYIVNNNLLGKVFICLDFKTSVDDLSKMKKWVIGTRAMQKAFLLALLEPSEYLKRCYEANDNNSKSALEEEFKTYPFGAVWDYFCRNMDVPVGLEWLDSGSHINE